MRRMSLLIVLAAVTLVPSAWAGEPLFLWQVAGEHATVSLTGSIHVGRTDFFPLAEPLEQAFAASDALAVEVDVADPAVQQAAAMLMLQKGMLPADETLQSRLGDAVWGRLQAFAESRGIPLAVYGRFRPGIVAMILLLEEYKRQGLDPELGIDQHFLAEAKEAGKPVRQLETIEAQLDLFVQVDDVLDDIMIGEMLDQMADLAAETDRMIALWRAGDADGLERMMAEQTGDDPAMLAFYRKLLDDRNAAMADSVDAWLRGDRGVFVVVGAGHFGGENGLVRLLEGKGWAVEQVAR